MIIVAGALTVDPGQRDTYMDGCLSVVKAARRASGCRDFALSPDLLDAGRINVFERWDSEEDLHRFRGSGPDDGQLAPLLSIDVEQWTVDS
jgi:quinol monooxygenase YgiN